MLAPILPPLKTLTISNFHSLYNNKYCVAKQYYYSKILIIQIINLLILNKKTNNIHKQNDSFNIKPNIYKISYSLYNNQSQIN